MPAPHSTVVALLDIDGTNTDVHGRFLNTAIIDSLKQKGVTDIYFFTTMSRDTLANDLELECKANANRTVAYTRQRLIEEYRKAGFNVRGVVTPMDCADDSMRLGEGYLPFARLYNKIREQIKPGMSEEAAREMVMKVLKTSDSHDELEEVLEGLTRKEVAAILQQIQKNETTGSERGLQLAKDLGAKGSEQKGFKIPAADGSMVHFDTKGMMAKKILAQSPDIKHILLFDDLNSVKATVPLVVNQFNEGKAEKDKVGLTVMQFDVFNPRQDEEIMNLPQTLEQNLKTFNEQLENISTEQKVDWYSLFDNQRQKQIENDFLIEFRRIIANEQTILDAVRDRMVIKKDGYAISLEDKAIFDSNGQINRKYIAEHNITIDEERLSDEGIAYNYGIIAQPKSDMGKIIFDAAIATARANVTNRYMTLTGGRTVSDYMALYNVGLQVDLASRNALRQLEEKISF